MMGFPMSDAAPSMERRPTRMGPVGSGQTTKLCNQVIVGCAMAVRGTDVDALET
jgi:3-hydroxyisobutyrate dehydrogenase-like beta-hydroxyacid dehydrogenase